MNKAVFSSLAVFGVMGALAPIQSAHAVVLEQKWQPGQSLAYQTEINGTANVQVPADAPIIIAGVPIEVEISGVGTTELRTLKVDEKGVGTIQVRVPKFDLNGQALGQKGQFSLLNNTSKITLNGKLIKMGDGTNPLAQPAVAMRISPQGRFLGVENLNPPAPKPVDPNAKPVNPEQAFDTASLMIATITRALPTLWPQRDVQNGETWQAEISWPIPSKEDPKVSVPTQLGKWDLTLEGEDTVNGRVLQRVAVDGNLNIDTAQFAGQISATATQMPKDANGAAMAEINAKTKQSVKGDVWFDAVAGQIVKADLVIGARVDAGMGKKASSQAWADFTGSMQMNLKPATAA